MKNPFGITTRKCRKSDHSFVYRMVLQLKPHVSRRVKWDKKHFDDSFRATYRDMIILMKGKRKIGMFQIIHNKSHTYIRGLYLSPAYQKKGIGTFFMKHFEHQAKKNRKRSIRLEVWFNNPAVKFYRTLGYKIIKKQGHKYFMEKRIKK